MKRIVLFAAALLASSAAQALDCKNFLEMHAFASRAQFQCGFNQYNNDIIETARECSAKMSDAAIKENLMTGMKKFNAEVSKVGMKRACEGVLRNLHMVVRR